MPAESGNTIDTSRKELAAAAAKENTGEIKKAEDIFKDGGLVDEFQGLDKTLKITPGESKNYFEKGKGDVSKLLVRMAERGKWLVENPGVTTVTPESAKKTPEKKKEVPKETERIDTLASSLKSTLEQYRDKLTIISEINTKRAQAFAHLENVRQMQSGADVTNVAPNVPFAYAEAIGNMMYGKNGEAGMYEVIRMLKNSPGLPAEYLKECQTNFNEKIVDPFVEIRIKGLQQQAIFTMEFEGEMLRKYIEMSPGKKQKDKPEFTWTSEGEQLPDEKKQKILLMVGGIRIQEEEAHESAACSKITEKFWAGKALLETGKFDEAKVLLEEFLKSDVNSLSKDKNLKGKKEVYEKQAKEMLAQIETVSGSNKDFFEAQKKAQSGEIIVAKKLLKKYLSEHEKDEAGKTNFMNSAKELLKRIALVQVADAREKFKIHKEPPAKIFVYKRDPNDPEGKEQIAVEEDNPEYGRYHQYMGALDQVEKGINDGKYIDFTDAYNAILSTPGAKFDPADDFNLLADQVTLDKGTDGKEGLLELARKYREKGRSFGDPKYLAVAEQYFMQYFGTKLSETSKKFVTIADIAKKYDASPTVQASITEEFNKVSDEVKKKYDEAVAKNPEWGKQHSWAAYQIEARNGIANQVYSNMQVEETLKRQNSLFIEKPENIGNTADQAIWGEFMNMKGMHGQGKWNEPLALSDEQVGHLMKELPIDIAMIAASGALAAATAGAASGLVLEAGMSIAAREAAKFGVRSGLRQFAAYAVSTAVETTVFTASHSVLNSIRTKELSITNWGKFQEEWLGNLKVMGGLGLIGRASAALKLGKLTSFGTEMAAMAAMQGTLGINDFAMVLGLKVGHAAPEVVMAARGKLAKKRQKTEISKIIKKPIIEELRSENLISEKDISESAPTIREKTSPSDQAESVKPPFKLSPELHDKIYKTGKKLTTAEESIILQGMEEGAIHHEVIMSLIESGRMKISERTIDILINQNPIKIIKILNQKNIQLSEKHQVMALDILTSTPEGFETALELIEAGKLNLRNPKVFSTFISTEQGIKKAMLYIYEGHLLMTQELVNKMLSQKKWVDELMDLFVKNIPPTAFLDANLNLKDLQNQILKQRAVFNDADNIHWEIWRDGKKVTISMKESFERIENRKANAESSIDGTLIRLKERDPYGYELLKNNLEQLDRNYIQAIIQGSKIEFVDHSGEKITAYVGKAIGQGGMGSISAVAYAVDGSSNMQFDVIKKPHENQKKAFAKEAKSAEFVQPWDTPFINKAKHIGNKFIIYETGPNARDFWNSISKMSPKQRLKTIRSVIEGIIYYQKKGYLHGDLKEANIIIFDGPSGPITQIIDNSPYSGKKTESEKGAKWCCTPEGTFNGKFRKGYINLSTISKVQLQGKSYRAIDNFAIGAIMENIAEHSQDSRVKDLAIKLKNPDISSEPGFLENLLPNIDQLIIQSTDMTPQSNPFLIPDLPKINISSAESLKSGDLLSN